MLMARYTMISCGEGVLEGNREDGHPPPREAGAHLGEDGHADVVVAGLVDEGGQLVGGDGGGDGLLPGLGGQTHRQVLLMGQQIRAGLPGRAANQERERETRRCSKGKNRFHDG